MGTSLSLKDGLPLTLLVVRALLIILSGKLFGPDYTYLIHFHIDK